MAKVDIPGLRELYETDDQGFLMFVSDVVDRTVDARSEAARKAGNG